MVLDDSLLVALGLHDLLEDLSNTDVGRVFQMNDAAGTEFDQLAEPYPERGNVPSENDEAIAHALQEEWSQLAVNETAVRSKRSQDEHAWLAASKDTWLAGELGQSVEYGPSLKYDDGLRQQLSEDSSSYYEDIDKRLTLMDVIPHVPRVNGEIPTSDDASASHQRLFDRLKLYGLSEIKVDGDGNCQFRALSEQLYQTPVHHNAVRDEVVNQLASHPEFYQGYVPMNYDEYVKKMSKSGEWGDHVTLQAAADFYGVKISLVTSFKDTCFIQISPRKTKSKRVVFLSFWAEVHYNSIHAGEGYVQI